MSIQSNSGASGGLSVDLLYERVVVGQGVIRLTDSTHAFLVIRDFPLGADTFIELACRLEDGKSATVPVRILANTGEGLEVRLESFEPQILAKIRPSEDLRP